MIGAALEGASFAFLLYGFTHLSSDDTHMFLLLILGAIGSQLVRSLFMYLGQFAMNQLTVNLQTEAQTRIYKNIFSLSYLNVMRYKLGDLIDHASAPPTIFPLIMHYGNLVLTSALMILAYLLFMAYISWSLTLSVLALFATASLVQKFIIKKILQASEQHSSRTVDLNKQTAQNLDGLKTVHLFDRQEHVLKKIHTHLQTIAKATLRLGKWNYLISPINEVIAITLVGISLVLGLYMLPHTSTLIALLMTYLTLTYRLGMKTQVALSSAGMIGMHFGAIKRMCEMLNTQEGPERLPPSPAPVTFKAGVEIDNLCFAYPQATRAALHDITLSIKKGETIAFVGPSGGGKSTLLHLLLRLFEPSSGRITLDGDPHASIALGQWRSLFGVVNQDVFLFHDSVEENIRFGKLTASREEVIEAAKLAGAHDFIEKLPGGYDTLVGEKGYKLSGGERQRLSLARALVRKPQILVLDEATSNLDSGVEAVIQEALYKLKGEMTIIIVAHRLSTVTHADAICVLQGGEVTEQGTHTQLLMKNGGYAKLWELQSKTTIVQANAQ